jgi:hypothetical protein
MKPLLPHTALEFKRNEIKTLEYIQTRGIFDNDFADLSAAISSAHSRYRGIGKKDFDFFFVSDFEIEIEGTLRKVVVHAEVSGNYNITTYSLGICATDSMELIRRFHFDYDHKTVRAGQKAFISHLQYGGKSGAGYTNPSTPFGTDNLEHWLSEPRLNFPPINLALLLDIVFCEFQDEKQKKIIEDPDWRQLVKDNEVFVLKQYFQSISYHIDTVRHNKDTLVRDICYA